MSRKYIVLNRQTDGFFFFVWGGGGEQKESRGKRRKSLANRVHENSEKFPLAHKEIKHF